MRRFRLLDAATGALRGEGAEFSHRSVAFVYWGMGDMTARNVEHMRTLFEAPVTIEWVDGPHEVHCAECGSDSLGNGNITENGYVCERCLE